MTSTYVLGTGLSHDGSTCLLKDGRIAVAIEKERLTRKKHDGFNDVATMEYCLAAEGIGFEDIALVVENNMPNRFERGDQRRRLGRIVPRGTDVVNISHHLAHAYSALGTAPYPLDDVAVVVMDGRGSSLDNCMDAPAECLPEDVRALPGSARDAWWEKESVYRYTSGRLVPVLRDFSPLRSVAAPHIDHPMAPPTLLHGVAEFYGGVTRYVFDSNFAQGKLMGLAPYGRRGRHKVSAFRLEEGRAFVRYDALERFPRRGAAQVTDFGSNFQTFADIASWAQDETERATTYLFEHYRRMTGSPRAAYVGGLALNAVINGKLLTQGAFDDIYFQPAAGDGGIAIGCAYYGWMEMLGRTRVTHDGSAAFGRLYSEQEISDALAPHRHCIDVRSGSSIVHDTVDALVAGKVVGWFQGQSEFGPRALGHRSILADARRPEMRDHINRNIKRREDFRPFAPAVMSEVATEYFHLIAESPYMIVVQRVRESHRGALPAVVHCDGSARVQTVTAQNAPRFYALLDAFGRRTGTPILLNTSFNGRRMPIVERPEEAIAFFLDSALDVLAIGDLFVTKRSSALD